MTGGLRGGGAFAEEERGWGRGRGRVVEFDEKVGLGRIASSGGDLLFHCTQIRDGSRTVAAGTEVTYSVIPGRLGRWEAGDVAPAS